MSGEGKYEGDYTLNGTRNGVVSVKYADANLSGVEYIEVTYKTTVTTEARKINFYWFKISSC